MKLKRFFLLAIACMAFGLVQAQITIVPDGNKRVYVTETGTGNGNDWTNATGSLADALEYARQNSGAITEIWVAAGTYSPASGTSFSIPAGVTVYGGYPTGGGGDVRNPATNTTTLQGNGAGVVTIAAADVVLDGFTVTGGNSTTGGAGISVSAAGANASLNQLTVTGNTSSASGGGISFNGASNVILKNSLVYNNTTTASSSTSASEIIFGSGGSTFLQNSTVVGNSTNKRAIYTSTQATQIILQNSILTNANYSLLGYNNGGIIKAYNSYIQTPSGSNAIRPDEEVDCIYGEISSLSDLFDSNFVPILCSALINAGNNSYVTTGDTDLDNNPRIVDTTVDIGCYEYQVLSLPQHSIDYDNTVADNGDYDQTVTMGDALDDIYFVLSGGATGAVLTQAPAGIELVVVDAGAKTYKLTGSPTGNPGYNEYIITTTGTTNDCTFPQEYAGEITLVAQPVTPDANGILYVKKGATGFGSSWGDALGELSEALLRAGSTTGDIDVEQIWVGTGTAGVASTFNPQYLIDASLASDDKNKTFLLLDGMKIYGGFDPESGITDITHARDNSLTVLDGQGSVYHVIVAVNQNTGDNNHIVIDGFTITGGNANGTSNLKFLLDYWNSDYHIYQNMGAGIYAEAGYTGYDENSFITINNNNIHTNTAANERSAGAGIWAQGYVSITNNTISNNTITNAYNSMGGGIAAYYSGGGGNDASPAYKAGKLRASETEELTTNFTISNNIIADNSITGNSISGGGIVLAPSNYPTTSSASAPAYLSDSDGIQKAPSIVEPANLIKIFNNTITGNKVSGGRNVVGGGISAGYIYATTPVAPALRSSMNKIDVDVEADGEVFIGYNWIADNNSICNDDDEYNSGDGGGIYVDQDFYHNVMVANNVIVENNASSNGGGIFVDQDRNAGVLSLNNTISANTATASGSGISGGSSLYVCNSIIWGNTGASEDLYFYYWDGSLINSLIGSAYDFNYDDQKYLSDDIYGSMIGNSYDPLFLGGTGDNKYTLTAGSQAINVGNNEFWNMVVSTSDAPDFAGNARIFNRTIDMGAYEAEVCPTGAVTLPIRNGNNGETTVTVVPDANGIVYVKDYSQAGAGTQPTTADGSSWEAAHPSLADVLLYAYNYPDCIEEIWVAEGTHYPEYVYWGSSSDGTFNDRYKLFLMVSGVNVYGGFPADATSSVNNDKDNISHRNWDEWKTVLSGDLYDNDISLDFSAIDEIEQADGEAWEESKKDNAYHVVISVGLTQTTELNGFVITGGHADEDNNMHINESDYSVDIYNNYGGGIACFESIGAVSFYGKNLRITENFVNSLGGGVYIDPYSNPVFVNTLIDNNVGSSGGGVYIGDYTDANSPPMRSAITSAGTPLFTNVTIAHNIARNYGGGVYVNVSSGSRNANIYNNIVWGNTSYDEEDGVTVISSGIYVEGDNTNIIDYSIIQDYDGEEASVSDIDPEFLDPTNTNISLRDYRLQSTSPAIDAGNNPYYYDAVDEANGGLLADERDLGAVTRIIGTAIDMGPYEFDPCPPIVVWLGITADWHDADNWYPAAVPQSCTDVYIPGKAVITGQSTYLFPLLSTTEVAGIENNTCRNIYFMPGAQLGRPDLLTYEEAHVQIDYGEGSLSSQATITKETLVGAGDEAARDAVDSEDRVQFGAATSGVTLKRDCWHMLSAPLGELHTGDYSFGGFPFSYIMKFQATHETNAPNHVKGSWAAFDNEADHGFKPGMGFGHFYYPYMTGTPYGQDNSQGSQWADSQDRAGVTSTKPESKSGNAYGLAQSNGILHFPYFDDTYLSDARRAHVYAEETGEVVRLGTSTFYFFWESPLTWDGFLAWSGREEEVDRTGAAYRFIFEEMTDGQYTMEGSFDEGAFILLGNPYMSALDFDAFKANTNNTSLVKDVYHVYYDEENESGKYNSAYQTYGTGGTTIDGATSRDKYIPPMQSFLVELATVATDPTFTFDPATMATTSTTAKLKASQAEPSNRLVITASNPGGEVSAYIRHSAEAKDGFCTNDFSKLIDDRTNRPEIYTLVGMDNGKARALLMNTIQSNDLVVPVGIYSSYSGNITLTIAGMNNYDAKVFFIDSEKNTETEITGQESFTFSFNHQPSSDGSALEGRFSLRFVKSPTGMDMIQGSSVSAYAFGNDLVVTSSTGNSIRSVTVYDLQGRQLFRKEAGEIVYYKAENVFQTTGVYLVKIHTAQGVKDMKVIR